MPAPVEPQTATISPGATLELERVEHGGLAAVGEAHRLEAHGQRPRRQMPRRRRLGQRLDPLEPGEAAARRRERPLAEVRDPAERLERPDELEQQRLEEDELADREVAADHLAAAEEDDGGDRERRQVVEAGQVARLDARLADHRVAHRLGLAAEAAAHVVLAAERLHHLDPDDGLVGRLGDVALALLHLPRERRDAAREPQREHGDRRHRDGGVEREPRVDDHEHDRRGDDHHQALRPLHEPPADEVADGVEVVRRPREHLAGRMPVVERARVAQVRLVEQLAHPRLDPDPDPGGRVAAAEVDPEAEQGEDDDRGEVRPEPLRVADDGAVDRALEQQRDRGRDQRVHERAGERPDAHAPLGAPEAEQPAEGRQQAEVGRIDGVRVFGHGKPPAAPDVLFPRQRARATIPVAFEATEAREPLAAAACGRGRRPPARRGFRRPPGPAPARTRRRRPARALARARAASGAGAGSSSAAAAATRWRPRSSSAVRSSWSSSRTPASCRSTSRTVRSRSSSRSRSAWASASSDAVSRSRCSTAAVAAASSRSRSARRADAASSSCSRRSRSLLRAGSAGPRSRRGRCSGLLSGRPASSAWARTSSRSRAATAAAASRSVRFSSSISAAAWSSRALRSAASSRREPQQLLPFCALDARLRRGRPVDRRGVVARRLLFDVVPEVHVRTVSPHPGAAATL